MRILAAASPGEIRLALTRSGTMIGYAIWRPGAPDGVGDLHMARVTAKVSAMAGCFLLTEDGEAFLPDSQSPDRITVGDHLPVRVTRAAQSGKGSRVTAFLTGAERAVAAALPTSASKLRRLCRGPSPLDEWAVAHSGASILVDDPALAATLRAAYGARVTRVDTAFDDAMESEVAALAHGESRLPGGMRAIFSPTPALTAIDMDAGPATAARAAKAAAQFDANRAALPELARQISLRNLSGAIVVDFAGMPARRRALLGPDLSAALASDDRRPRLAGFSNLGFAEIVRPRVHPPLHEVLQGPHAAGLAAFRQADRLLAGNPATRLALRAAPPIIAALQADPIARADLARRITHAILWRCDPAMPPDDWLLEPADV